MITRKMATVPAEVGCGGLYVDPGTCWEQKADRRAAIVLLRDYPHHGDMVRALSASLLDTLMSEDIDPSSREDSVREWRMIAAQLVSDKYPGSVHLTDEIRSRILVHLSSVA